MSPKMELAQPCTRTVDIANLSIWLLGGGRICALTNFIAHFDFNWRYFKGKEKIVIACGRMLKWFHFIERL